MKDKTLFLLVDCNNFFVSCERLFRPDLEKKPVLVLSSNDGCVISRSKEVKELGIPMGIPYFEIRELVKKEKVTVFSSNFTLYRDISERVMEVLRTFSSEVVQYSIDEAFITIPEKEALGTSRAIREKVFAWVGIPVSVGVAPTRTLAKFAAHIAKKEGGVASVTEPLDDERLLQASVREIWGVGRSSADTLEMDGIKTVRDMLMRTPGSMRALLGKNGERTYLELSGISSPHESLSAHHAITSTRSFGTVARSLSVLTSALTHHVSELAERLRREHLYTAIVSIEFATKISGERKHYFRTSQTLLSPSNSTSDLLAVVLALVRTAYKKEDRYVKAGVTLSGLTPEDAGQIGLFETPKKDTASLMKTLDSVTAKYGSDALHYGTLHTKKRWASRSEFLSPSYTTSWHDLKKTRTL